MISIIKTKCKSNTYEEMEVRQDSNILLELVIIFVGKWYELKLHSNLNSDIMN
jgi:hypothetical protein